MPPSLSDYQAAAQAIYQPQLEADITTSKASSASKIANLETSKGQIQTNYTSAIQNLQNSVQDQTGKIGQLYTSRLLGNTSGLQGNDMGEMYARANQTQGTIESSRANALNGISVQQANINNEELAGESALRGKYQGLQADYANSGYSSAVKDYQSKQLEQQKMAQAQENMAQAQANSDRQYGLDVARLNLSAQSANNATSGMYKASAKAGNQGFAYTGPNGQALNLGQYAKSIASNSTDALKVIKNQLQASNTDTDKKALDYFNSQMKKYNGNFNQVVGAISNKKEFASLFNGM